MLNISSNRITDKFERSSYSSLTRVEKKNSKQVLIRLLTGTMLIAVILSFLPWTQNIRSNGEVSTLKPNQRPQTIHSIIAGRIEKWYVQEGDYVKEGDTLAQISEIKDDYFDGQLLERTKNQLDLKEMTVESYDDKIDAQEDQLTALGTQRRLLTEQARIKLQQTALKVQNDSTAYLAAKISYNTAKEQYGRMDSLYRRGLKSLVDLETRNLKMQETKAYEVEAKNKWLNSKNDLIALRLEISNIQTKFQNDYAKVQSDKFTTVSNKFEAESDVNKLKNQYTNYEVRSGLYFITAPQDGYITKTFVNGIGETIKEGTPLMSIMPNNYDLAVAIYVDPIDLPLLEIGQKVRIQFDGWPAIVFAGWPNVSYGTYGGKIYAIDQFLGDNGKYRILVSPDKDDHEWPKALRYGSGTNSMILLKDVPIWYELWRKINGFPADYYKPKKQTNTSGK
jgi:membrane fusion protein, adhesin transport system